MLNPSPEFIVRAYFDAWGQEDVERALSYLSPDVDYRMYIDESVVSFAGASLGIDALRARMLDLQRQFELLWQELVSVELVGQQARCLARAEFRHRKTLRVLDLTHRFVFRVVGKEIIEAHEYHDADRIRAFLELVTSETSGQEPPAG